MGLIQYLIDLVVGIVELILGLRLLLKLMGANTQAPFVHWIYATSQPLLEPFANIFPTPALEKTFILEFSTLFAILIYAIIGAVLIQIFSVMANIQERTMRKSNQKV